MHALPDPARVRRALDDLVARGAMYADARSAASTRTTVEWKDGETTKAVPGSETGFGIRVLVGGAWGLASGSRADELAATAEAALRLAKSIADDTAPEVALAPVKPAVGARGANVRLRPDAVPLESKILLAARAGRAAQGASIASVRTAYDDSVTTTRFVSTEGADLETTVTRVLLEYDVAARADGRTVGYRERIGGTRGLELFDAEDPEAKGRAAADGARRVLHAKKAPSGVLPVLCDPDLTGVFAHEAIGHACEADLVLAGESILAGRIGETLGSSLVTIVDDATIEGAFGHLAYDDEGVRAERKVLLERGVLRGYIHSRETAGRLDMAPNGGARAESFSDAPMVRMSNTMVERGDASMEELLEGVKRGVLAKGTRGGQVDVAKGTFQFSAQEATLIEDGELTTPLADVSLQGDILRTLREIDAVGKDARLASPGICGKGQWVPVGDGGPHIRIARCRVGGGA